MLCKINMIFINFNVSIRVLLILKYIINYYLDFILIYTLFQNIVLNNNKIRITLSNFKNSEILN